MIRLSAVLLPLLFTAGCFVDILAIEVLPPRTGPSCLAPASNAGAFGRGLLDVEASTEFHGAYLADLRLSATGDLVVDGLELNFVLPAGAEGGTKDDAKEAAGEVALGDLLLDGDGDEVRSAVLENVELLPRSLVRALRSDGELTLSRTEYEIVTVEILATRDGEPIGTDPSTFAIDVCKGCLTTRPTEEECAADKVVFAEVCRPGQDDQLFSCDSGSGITFP